MDDAAIVLAGATGNLGGRIARALVERGARPRVLVRPESDPERVEALRRRGATIAEVDFESVASLTEACAGARCVVSALNGLRAVIVEAQGRLLDAAVAARVPRYIPSDYAIDFTRLPAGTNRNFDLRREHHARIDDAPIAATSIFNGAFTDMLTGQAPFILFPLRRVLYWEDADRLLDFTTMDDTASFTAAAALDPSTPRALRVAGDEISARGLARVMSEVTSKRYRLLRAGGLARLEKLILLTRTLTPETSAVFPAWQGMQYMRDMFDGRGKLAPLDNDRYPSIRWTTARDVLSERMRQRSSKEPGGRTVPAPGG